MSNVNTDCSVLGEQATYLLTTVSVWLVGCLHVKKELILLFCSFKLNERKVYFYGFVGLLLRKSKWPIKGSITS